MAEKYDKPLRARDEHYTFIRFDIFHEESLPKAEFFVHCIITRMKYMVSNGRYDGWRPKPGIELTSLLEFATKEYLKSQRQGRRRNASKKSMMS